MGVVKGPTRGGLYAAKTEKSTFKGDLIGSDGVEGFRRNQITAGLDVGEGEVVEFVFNGDFSSGKDIHNGLGNFRTNTITGQKSDFVDLKR